MTLFSSQNYRQKLIALFTFLGGVYFFLYFVIPETILINYNIKQHHEDISLGFIAIGLLTFGLGIINLLMIHGGKIIYLKKGWSQSLALIGSLFIMIAFSILDWSEDLSVQRKSSEINMLLEFTRSIQADAEAKRTDVPEPAKRIAILFQELKKEIKKDNTEATVNPYSSQMEINLFNQLQADYKIKIEKLEQAVSNEVTGDSLKLLPETGALLSEVVSVRREILRRSAENTFSKKFYKFLFEGLFVALGSAMFSLLGVYIAAAAYRAFRIKTWESTLMMLAALIVMLGQISFGSWIYSDMPAIRGWLLEVPNSSVARAISIGASVAGLVLAFRMWFSIETDSFSDKKGKGK